MLSCQIRVWCAEKKIEQMPKLIAGRKLASRDVLGLNSPVGGCGKEAGIVCNQKQNPLKQHCGCERGKHGCIFIRYVYGVW